jgi:hypothetical protein
MICLPCPPAPPGPGPGPPTCSSFSSKHPPHCLFPRPNSPSLPQPPHTELSIQKVAPRPEAVGRWHVILAVPRRAGQRFTRLVTVTSRYTIKQHMNSNKLYIYSKLVQAVPTAFTGREWSILSVCGCPEFPPLSSRISQIGAARILACGAFYMPPATVLPLIWRI